MRKHYSYNASGPNPDATDIWDAHLHRDVPGGGASGIWDSHIHMGAPYEKHYSYNASSFSLISIFEIAFHPKKWFFGAIDETQVDIHIVFI